MTRGLRGSEALGLLSPSPRLGGGSGWLYRSAAQADWMRSHASVSKASDVA